MAYYFCKKWEFSAGRAKCGLLRKRNNGLCRSCLDILDDKLYDAYKQWWGANYEKFNKMDENPVKKTDAPAAYSTSSHHHTPPPPPPPATQSSGKMPRLTDLDAEQKEQKRQKKSDEVLTDYEINHMTTRAIITEMTMMLAELKSRHVDD